MSHPPQSAPPGEARDGEAFDYAAIERSLLATEQGRRFLAAYLERNRCEETRILLEAAARLERSVCAAESRIGQSHLKADILGMFESFARTRREIARIRPPADIPIRNPFARCAFAGITETMENATHAVLEAAEEIHSAVQSLRERGADERCCLAIERRLSEVHRACAAHDHTLQRNVKIVELLAHIESELTVIIEGWRCAPAAGESAGADARTDGMTTDVMTTDVMAESRALAAAPPLQQRLVEALALSILNETQRQALFT